MCKVSFVIVSYNQAEFIRKTILSILAQKISSFEILVIDGGSSDHTIDIIKEFSSKINLVISEPDTGQVDALIKGISRAKGDWITWQNSDDLYGQKCIIKLLETADKNPEADILYGDIFIIDEFDNVKAVAYSSKFSLKSHAYNTMGIFNQSLLIRKSSLDKLGLPRLDLHYAFDFEWFLRWGFSNIKLQYVPNAFGCFRVHSLSKTSLKADKFANEVESILSEYNLAPINKLEYTIIKFKRMFSHLKYRRYRYVFQSLTKSTGLTHNPYSKKSLYGID